MSTSPSSKRSGFITLALLVFLTCAAATQIKAQTVWVVCTWDTSSIYHQRDGKEKFERRFYVTDMIQTTTNVYVALTNRVPGLETPCGAYLEKTVLKAAQDRGEGIEPGTLKVIKNIEDSGEDVGSRNRWSYAPKEKVEQKRAEMIKEMQDAGRVIIPFNWDLSGQSEAADLAKERQKRPGGIESQPAPRPSPQATPAQTTSSRSTTAKPIAPANYMFAWARVLTSVQDLDKRSANVVNRAYYSNILAFVPTTDVNALKTQMSSYFSQEGPAYAMKAHEKIVVKDVSLKTFPTLYEADNARYGAATQDYNGLNANASTDVPLPVSYFNWNYYGSRHDLFPNLSEFVTTGYVSSWEFIVVEATAEKQVNGQPVHETRYYVSYPYELFMTGTESIKKTNHLDSYFTKTVVEPAGQRGTKISYYTNSFEIFPASSPYKTFAEAWAARTERVDTIKGNGYPQYDFLVISNGPNKGEGTSFPFCAATCSGEHARVTALEKNQ
ncbi:MAG TPA: hypothetical protein VE961_04805 [Pyrinomonadaceae bacterium]|nr:hypothetical protein [Pyrinomonadaceae bacterium]